MIRIPFFSDSPDDASKAPSTPQPQPPAAPHPLDALTGGIFSAATSGERAAKVRAWLATTPDHATLQEVYKELSLRDKGAAKPLREKLDEIKRSKGQEALAAEWAARAEALLQASRFHIADAMAWQRDAAKAGAPLSREPLQALKAQLAERIQQIEDLQTRTQVQREAAALLAQRIELLSTKSWRQADAVQSSLHADVQHWHTQTQQLQQDAHWPHVDARHTQALDAARQQLDLVVQAFMAAVDQTRAAAADSSQPLPPVQVWADELRAARNASATPSSEATPQAETPADTAAHSARQAEAQSAVQPLLQTLEAELAKGQGKTVASAAHSLRQALKEHGRFLLTAFEAQVQTALAKASELEGWQRWRADQLRTELVQKAEALIHRPAPANSTEAPAASDDANTALPAAVAETSAPETAPETAAQTAPSTSELAATADEAPTETTAAAVDDTTSTPGPATEQAASTEATPTAASATEGQTTGSSPATPAPAAANAGPLPTSPHSPRKLQELLRQLREQWKEVDQGGLPNHALWRRFDQACNEAYRIVQAWLAQMKQQAAEQKALRVGLLGELKSWGESLAARAAQASDIDWKTVHRELSNFSQRWREAGHVSEKVFAELQPQWKAALQQAAQPLHSVQQASLGLRQQLIEQAQALSEGPLRIDAIKELQQRWQQEAQRVPLERRQEQKLWDAFRKPIDLAFQRRSQQRTQIATAASQRDQAVLQAVQALDAATASGDAQAIRQAMQTLEAAMRAQQTTAPTADVAATPTAAATAPTPATTNAEEATSGAAQKPEASDSAAAEPSTEEATGSIAEATEAQAQSESAPASDTDTTAEASAAAPAAPSAALRPVVAMRGDDRPGARIASPAAARPERDARRPARASTGASDTRRDGKRPLREDARTRPHTPRLGDAAFRAQREAVERAQTTLRKLAAQAHGETLMQVLAAWEQRAADALPPANALGKALDNTQRNLWVQALRSNSAPTDRPSSEALLRLEMAADAPTPAEHLEARRALQLQLLTRRNEAAPRETWAEDVAHVLAAPYDAAQAKRLQSALRLLLNKR